MRKSSRNVIVFVSLVAVLTLTSAILLALAPAPLVPESATSLYAVEQPNDLDLIFETRAPMAGSRWKYIYVRHSRTPTGSAETLAEGGAGGGDHFVIGNGAGSGDGEIQVGHRWDQQLPAQPPPGANKMDPACITICLIGDFDTTVPTPTQYRRLEQLVSALQGRLNMRAQDVLMFNGPASPAAIGRHFPTSAFREQLRP